jgi:uncharacterized membrane-anchored protein
MLGRLKRRRAEPAVPGAVTGTARVDKRTKKLLTRLQPGEIAVIDHEDIDRISAEGLIHRQVRAVINASKSSSGRYPNLGPLLLCSAEIVVIDDVGPELMNVPEGARLVIEDGRILRKNGSKMLEVGNGRVLTLPEAEKELDESKQSIATSLEQFAANTMGYIKDERDVLLEAARLPEVQTDFHGRHVLIVVRGHDYKEDLGALRYYIREVRPLLVGVDGGADALLDFGLKPDVIIGDMDSVTTEALLSGAELVVHAYSGGVAPGLERIDALGLPCVVFESTGTSEDIGMLLAFERGAELIVAVGTHANLVEFMDKGRKGMASTFLVRLRVGSILVDAKGMSRVYKGRIRRRDLAMLVGAALATMGTVVALSEPLRYDLRLMWIQVGNAWESVTRALFG